jgi:hypothetical protein
MVRCQLHCRKENPGTPSLAVNLLRNPDLISIWRGQALRHRREQKPSGLYSAAFCLSWQCQFVPSENIKRRPAQSIETETVQNRIATIVSKGSD